MGASVRPDDTSTPGLLPRVLAPDEFHQAKQMAPETLATNPFPVLPPVPPAAPKDQTQRLDPNAGPAANDPIKAALDAPAKLAGIMTLRAAQPIIEHPLLSAAVAGAAIASPLVGAGLAAYGMGVAGKNLLEYSAQRAAELTLPPDVRALAEQDPERIGGYEALGDAVLGATMAPGLTEGVNALRAGEDVVRGVSFAADAAEGIAAATKPMREKVADFIAPHLADERRSLDRVANTDALTGLGNQGAYRAALPAAEADPNTKIIRFDVNGFKNVNDVHGHEFGDEALAQIGQTIREQAPDLPVFRAGKGDEFAIFAPADQAATIRDAVEQGVGTRTVEGVHVQTGEPATTTHSISGGIGNTSREADVDAYARKTEQKAAQGIPDRASAHDEPIAAALPSGRAPQTVQLQRAVQGHVTDVVDALEQMRRGGAAPTPTASPELPANAGADAKTILRANLGDAAANYEQAAFKVDEFRRAIDWLPERDKLGFVDAVEHGQSQPTKEFQPLADYMRQTLDDTRDQVRALGTGKLEQYYANYFPHSGIWADPEQAERTFAQLAGGKRPMEGTKSFLKERSFPTVMDGINNGMQLAEGWNPIDVFLSNYRDMQRYLFAQKSFAESKEQGILRFVNAGEKAPDGYTRINDRMATVFGKPTVTINEAFDANQRAGIQGAIDQLGGVEVKRGASLGQQKGLMSGALGYAKGDREIGVKFGSHDGVLMHELGHIIDTRYGMGAELAKAPDAAAELKQLADLRFESNPKADATYRAYVQRPEEQAANALHAYLHAPETMREVAPNVYQALDDFLGNNPKLAGLRDIKPSLEIGTGTTEVPVGGMVVRGEYWAPKDVATVFNNHLSPGLPQVLQDAWGPQWGGAAAHAFELYRGIGNVVNQAQLGLSAFHLGMTSLDATVSRAALGLEDAAGGRLGSAAKNIATAPVAALPSVAQGIVGDLVNHVLGTDIQMGLGAKLRQAYLNPSEASPEMVQLARYVREAGGRVTQDSFYKTSAADQWMSGLRDEISALGEGRLKDAFSADWRAGKVALPAMLEMAAKPIMEHIVPLQKLQVFGELAQKVVRELPPDATLAERRAALQSAWDSVDNRMGQLVYDNLFWNKTFKDLAMASTRSVGWNLGTIRELGGGSVDLATAGARAAAKVAGKDLGPVELTHRAAYTIALPVMIGLYGAAYQYLRTGQGPSELKDYFYPKTGEQDADGNDERVQLPSYMKDLVAYAGSPWQTVTHKEAPLPSIVYEMLQNKDFYGDEIRNPLDPAVKQIGQEADYIGKSVLPFALTNQQEQAKRGDQSAATKFGNWFGVTPAPRHVVRSDAQNLMAEDLASKGPAGGTPEDAVAQQERARLLASFRGVTDIDVDRVEQALNSGALTPPDIGRLLKRAGMTPAQEKFKRLSLTEALDVFDKGTDREKALFGAALMSKLQRVVGR
jgi:diguanylate cyclase (GGDEF)-like protein